jgi:multiple sugar transport system ATP-binding protein
VYVTHDQIEAMTLGDRIAVMEKGRLQQVGTPESLYRAPANRFVAGFMGSPSMNFATVELRADGDRVTVSLGGRQIELPNALRRHPDLARHLGSSVVMGLRPSAFSLARADDKLGLTIVPLGVEALGDEKHVLFEAPSTSGADVPESGDDVPVTMDDSTGTQLWTAKVGQYADLAIGLPVRLAVDLGAAYFFDPADGLAIPEVTPEPAAEAVEPTPTYLDVATHG